MQAHNLCYSTLVRKADLARLTPDVDYTMGPAGHAFLKRDKQRGVLPTILDELLGARKKAKAALKAEKEKGDDADHTKMSVYDGRQLALKVSANSVYGKPFSIRLSQFSAEDGLPCARSSSQALRARRYANYTFEHGSPSSMHTTRRSLLGQRYNPPFGNLYTAPCERCGRGGISFTWMASRRHFCT